MVTAKLSDTRPGILKRRTPEDHKNNPEARKNSPTPPLLRHHLLLYSASVDSPGSLNSVTLKLLVVRSSSPEQFTWIKYTRDFSHA